MTADIGFIFSPIRIESSHQHLDIQTRNAAILDQSLDQIGQLVTI
jgi:hypothetical protein